MSGLTKQARKENLNLRIKASLKERGSPDCYRTGPPWGQYDPIYNCILGVIPRWKKYEAALDIGCYLGDFTARLSEVGVKKIVGCDVSTEAIEYARNRHPEITFIASDHLDLKFREDFDLVVASGCLNFNWLHHKKEYLRAAKNIHGFLRSEGYFVEQNNLNAMKGRKAWSFKVMENYFDLVIHLDYVIHRSYAFAGRRKNIKHRWIRLYRKKTLATS